MLHGLAGTLAGRHMTAPHPKGLDRTTGQQTVAPGAMPEARSRPAQRPLRYPSNMGCVSNSTLCPAWSKEPKGGIQKKEGKEP